MLRWALWVLQSVRKLWGRTRVPYGEPELQVSEGAPYRITYPDLVIADSPLAWWRLGEAEGSVAHDSSGHGNDAVYVGAVRLGVPGLPGGGGDTAVSFMGEDRYLAVPESLGHLVNNFSVEAWFKNAQSGAPFVQIMGHKNIHRARFNLGSWRQNGWKVTKYTVADIFLGSVPADTEWHHIVLSWTSTEGTQLYLDGALAGHDPHTDDMECTRPFPVVGMAEEGSHWGDLDEVAVYDHALPADRILAHYLAGHPPVSGSDVTRPA